VVVVRPLTNNLIIAGVGAALLAALTAGTIAIIKSAKSRKKANTDKKI